MVSLADFHVLGTPYCFVDRTLSSKRRLGRGLSSKRLALARVLKELFGGPNSRLVSISIRVSAPRKPLAIPRELPCAIFAPGEGNG